MSLFKIIEDSELKKVSKVWEVLTRVFFQKLIGGNASVLDIGCGFCHFLNHLKANEKTGVDANPSAGNYEAKDGYLSCHVTFS